MSDLNNLDYTLTQLSILSKPFPLFLTMRESHYLPLFKVFFLRQNNSDSFNPIIMINYALLWGSYVRQTLTASMVRRMPMCSMDSRRLAVKRLLWMGKTTWVGKSVYF